MAFLLPAILSGLASWAVPKAADFVSRKVTGRGGRAVRRRARARAPTAAQLQRMLMPQSRGGALSIMNKWPLLSRPARYAIGGRVSGGATPLDIVNSAYRVLHGRPFLGRGGRTPRVSPGGMHMVVAHPSHSKFGALEQVRAHMARNPRPHMVRAHMAAGLLGFAPTPARGGRASRPRQPKLASVMRGAGMVGATHYVAPHISHTKYGVPVHVRGHYAANRGMGLLGYH